MASLVNLKSGFCLPTNSEKAIGYMATLQGLTGLANAKDHGAQNKNNRLVKNSKAFWKILTSNLLQDFFDKIP